VLLVAALAACAESAGGIDETLDAAAGGAAAGPEIFVGAGDVAWCEPPGVGSGEVTALLLDGIAGTVFTLGDNSNGSGTLAEYTSCFGPSWGRHLARIRPAPGNHDYEDPATPGQDYHGYFGAAAGPPGKGWYSYDLGAWHIVVLNSECTAVDCAAGSEQESWLAADLAEHPTRCTLAVTHRPHFATRSPTGSADTNALFADLYAAGVDVLLSGHYHWYERFAPQDPGGAADFARGVRQFIVGTAGSYMMVNTEGWTANSEAHLDDVFGVLELTLRVDGYDWRFVPQAGKESLTDSGSDVCR
jgi:hypothetical protein